MRNQPSVSTLFGLKEKQELSKNAVNMFGFDKHIYDTSIEPYEAIHNTIEKGVEELRTFDDFSQDLFMSLYKHKPSFKDMDEMEDTHRFNHQLLSQLIETDEFKQLRKNTKHDIISSALGLEALSEEALSIVQQYVESKKQQGEGDPFEDINNQVDQQNGQGQPKGGQSGQGQPQQGQGNGSGQGQPGNGQGQGQPKPGSGNQPSQEDIQNMVNQLKGATSKAAEDVSELRDFLDAWGMEDGDSSRRITYETKKYAMERLKNSPHLKHLSELIGRMKKIAVNEQKKKLPEGSDSIKSIINGDDVTMILPSEKALLASSNKNLNNTFYRKYHEKELLQYDKEAFETSGKGPMVVCVDTSGSMDGHRDDWAKATALSFLEVATKQKRDFACIHYDSRVQHVWEIPHGTIKPEDIFEIAERFSGGGTFFEAPLRKSIEIIEKNKKFSKADILFITDGDCGLDDNFLEWFNQKKLELKFKTHTVLIDMYGGGSTHTINQFSDRVVEVSNLADKESQNKGAQSIFKDI